jgi:hypothetical protein
VAEREVRLIFALKAFQSVLERAPLVVDEASPRESCCPERESPFAPPRVSGAWESDWRAETVPEREVRFVLREVREPESVVISERTPATVPERDVRFVVRLVRFVMTVLRVPESDVTCVVIWSRVPERVFIFVHWITVVCVTESRAHERFITEPERVS